ncbi:dynein light chain roadblock-type 2 [Maniola jurtina]|uniref:dynein light chain roadblock-type 2 n=1 Tax=Maniola jurtina TaxID=191418 RepID=UPI001E68A736|nr:dynein light chain roadblock-type 2 [Maniola jurtina]
MANEAEETVRKLAMHKGVVGVIVVNGEGIPIKTTLENHVSVQYAGLMSALVDKAKSVVRDLDPSNDLTFLRIRSKRNEVMVAPDKDFILIVIQNPVE